MVIIALLILMALFWIGFKCTGALLGMIIWVCVRLPLGLVLICVGLVLCCTIILIPIGKPICSLGWDILF